MGRLAGIKQRVLACFAGALLLGACATNVLVYAVPATLTKRAEELRSIVLQNEVRSSLRAGYLSRGMLPGTKWESVGMIEQGEVFRSKGGALTVRAGNLYEAYPVISGEMFIGVYLPGNKAFLAARFPVVVSARDVV